MFLKKVTLNNFRKFTKQNNTISLVQGHDIYNKEDKDAETASETEEDITKKYNFAENITLIVGKNNSGKTTIVRALEKISKDEKIYSSDFNYKYLEALVENIKEQIKDIDSIQNVQNLTELFPELSISLTIGFNHNENDLISNIYPILELTDFDNKNMEVEIEIKWIIKEQNEFFTILKDSTQSYENFSEFRKLIDDTEFDIKYYRSDKEITNFNIKKLLNVHVINATKVREPGNNLSKAFNKILNYRFKNILNNDNLEDLNGEIEQVEKNFVKKIQDNITKFNNDLSGDLNNINTSLNTALGEVVSDDLFEIILTSDLGIDKLLRNIIQYSYDEDGFETPEDNFGLGYSNLVMIIAEIIDYISKYQKPDTPESTINLIAIEEPEVHMHPQMQENFIINVEKMVNSLLLNFEKEISTQIIITTHSPHILNSKIHSGNSFNNINYINSEDGLAKAIPLNDESILSISRELQVSESITSETAEENEGEIIDSQSHLTFLKKHIKFQISEIFFSDAVIFVEGATEFTLMPYYLEKESYLSKKFITLAMVDGAHAHMYFPLLKLLEIPSLIITDLDIKRKPNEKGVKSTGDSDQTTIEYTQITASEINDRKTTNFVLKKYCNEYIREIVNKGLISVESNIMVTTQNSYINLYLPTSFEEAYILENIQNSNLIKALEDTKPQLSEEWIDDNKILPDKSFEIQMKLGDSKVAFPANVLLSSFEIDNLNLPELPTYIKNGFEWLSKELWGEGNG